MKFSTYHFIDSVVSRVNLNLLHFGYFLNVMALSRPANEASVADRRFVTQEKEDKFSFLWQINDFRYKVNKKLKSPTFSTGTIAKQKCCLYLYPNKWYSEKGYVHLLLGLVSSENSDVYTKFKCSILNASLQEEFAIQGEAKLSGSIDQGLFNFIKTETILDVTNNLLPAGTLTIFCEGSVVMDSNINGYKPTCHFLDGLGSIFSGEKFSDVTLAAAGGREFKVHKVILAAQSPVFEAMFAHDMQERERSHVNIPDIDRETLGEMLSFMYTGRARKLDKMAGDLLAAADKYALVSLKAMCEAALLKNLSIETATHTLVLAYLHSAEQLKVMTADFISKNLGDVTATAGWKKMVSTHPRVMEEVLRAIAPQRQAKRSRLF